MTGSDQTMKLIYGKERLKCWIIVFKLVPRESLDSVFKLAHSLPLSAMPLLYKTFMQQPHEIIV